MDGMDSMETMTFKVRGISPLLLHNPAGMLVEDDGKAKKKGADILTGRDEAATYCYWTGPKTARQLAIPSVAWRGCAVSGGKGMKFGKEFATTLVKGSVFVMTELTPLTNGAGKPLKTFEEVDTRPVVIGKSRVPRSRPKLEDWGAVVEFDVDTDFISREQVAEVLAIGGRRIGVGDYRPEKSGPFGRFEVVA